MKFNDFFWDFDGTLFDTYPRIGRAIQNALKDLGKDILLDTIAPLAKVSLLHAAKTLVPEQPEEAMRRYRVHAEEEGYESMQPYPGARRMLEAVCAHGGHNYLYTHRNRTAVDALRHYGLDVFFADFVTGEDGFPPKPAPDALLHLIKKHGLSPDQCIMLGDRDIDLQSGINAGTACALFDPDHYYDPFETPFRYTGMFEMMADLVWEQQAADLHISDMLVLQQELQDRHPEWGGVHPQRAASQLLWLIGEIGEVIDVVKKVNTQKLTEPGLPRQRLTEELADVYMYLNDILLCYGIDAAEFSQAYYGKMHKNLTRDYKAEHRERYGV